MRRHIPTITFAMIILALPFAGANAGAAGATLAFLEDPVQGAVNQMAPGDGKHARALDALQSQAYWAALTLAVESMAESEARESWMRAQDEAEPMQVFSQELSERGVILDERMRDVSEAIRSAESGISQQGAERLLVAAHALVQAQEALKLGTGFLTSVNSNTAANDIYRFTLTRPFSNAAVLSDVAAAIVAGPLPTGPAADISGWAATATTQRDALGMPASVALVEDPSLEALARHIQEYQRGLQISGSVTTHQVESALRTLPDDRQRLVEGGFAGIRPAALHADVVWWLAQADGEDPNWLPMQNQLYRDISAVNHEAVLMVGPSESGGLAALAWIIVAVSAGTAAVFGVWLVRQRRTPLAAVFLLVTSALLVAPIGHVEASPNAGDHDGDVAVSETTMYAARATLAHVDGQGFHFAWAECQGTGDSCTDGTGAGRMTVKYRSVGADGTWSPPVTLRDLGTDNAHYPQIHAGSDGLRLFWTEGYRQAQDKAITLWTCAVVDATCVQPQRISGAAAQVPEYDVAVDGEGRYHVAWQEEHGWETGTYSQAAVVLRILTGQTMGPRLEFDTGADIQRRPAVTADAAGNSHVAWLERPPTSGPDDGYRLVTHAFVERGASEAQHIGAVTNYMTLFNRDIAMAVDDQQSLHIIYGQEPNLTYLRKDAGSEDWTTPVEIWNPVAGQPRYVRLLAGANGLMAAWVDGPYNGFNLWTTTLSGGFWTEPRMMVGAPYSVLWPDLAVLDGAVHAVWTSADPEVDLIQVFYRAASLPPPAPPSIVKVQPAAGAWMPSAEADLTVTFRASQALDLDATSLQVDGHPVPFDIGPGGQLIASLPSLGEGEHQASAIVQDATGQRATTTWSFQVDTTPPDFSFAILDADDVPVESGWSQKLLRLEGKAEAGGGSPAQLQVRPSPELPWRNVPEEGLRLVEGTMFSLRLRAIDAVGNIQLGPKVSVGWDATPPNIQAPSLPAWGNSSMLRFELSEAAPSTGDQHDHDGHDHDAPATPPQGPGSPINVSARLLDGLGHVVASVDAPPGLVTMPEAPDGSYSLELLASDAAGNAQEPIRVQVGLDTVAPELRVETTASGGIDIHIFDATSRIASVVVATPGQAPQAFDGGGRPDLALPLPGVADRTLLTATDAAGNTESRLIRVGSSGAFLEEVASLDSSSDAAHKTPHSASLLATALAIALIMMRRGRRNDVNR